MKGMETKKTKQKNSPPSSLWHYTSFEVLTKIIPIDKEERKSNLTFWFSNPLQTNDKKEIRFFEEYVFRNKKGEKLREEVDKIKEKVGRPFTLSLIHHKEDTKSYPSCEIPMWKMYGNNFYGVRLRFDFLQLKKYCDARDDMELKQCIYLTKKAMGEKSRKLKEVNDKESVESIYKESPCYKTCNWEYENEWRLIKWSNDIKAIGFRPNDGRLYLPVTLPLELLETIEIGPKADQEAIEGSLLLIKKKLQDNSDVHFKIKRSKLDIGYV